MCSTKLLADGLRCAGVAALLMRMSTPPQPPMAVDTWSQSVTSKGRASAFPTIRTDQGRRFVSRFSPNVVDQYLDTRLGESA